MFAIPRNPHKHKQSVNMAEGGRAERLRRRRRAFRARRDVLAEYSDSELLTRYRFDRAGILFLADLLKDKIGSVTRRNRVLSPVLKVVITLLLIKW